MGFISVAQASGVIEDATPIVVVVFNFLQFLLSVASIIGILGTVIAGIWYFTAGGDEQRMRGAKRAMLACVVGTIVVLSALVIVRQIGNWLA